MRKVAIIAALKREVEPLISGAGWHVSKAVRAVYGSYRNGGVLVVCGGIGAAPARIAAEEAVRAFQPELLVSAGIAGALVPEWRVARIMVPERVIDSARGEPIACSCEVPGFRREGTLISASGIPGPEGKRLLAGHYRAQAVDMEAAAVAAVAQRHGIPIVAIKSISDEVDFPMPDLEPFVDEQGRFLTGRFVLHAVVRPSMWPVMSKLALNSSRASKELCRALGTILTTGFTRQPLSPVEPAHSIIRLEQSSR